MTATPTSGAALLGWSGAASGTSNPVTVAMDADKSIAANFTTSTHTLTIAVSGKGSTSPPAGSHAYASGSTVQVTPTAAIGSVFTGWSGAASGSTSPVTVTMDADKSLAASFAIDTSGLPDHCPGACDAAALASPSPSPSGGLGNVTESATSASVGGACGYGTTNVLYYAAINVDVQSGDRMGQWQSGKICGQCAQVTVLTSQGPKSVVVRIMDQCPSGFCGINLEGSAPEAVMFNGPGRYAGKWSFVSCAGHPEVSDGAASLSVLGGSNTGWARVRVQNPTSAVESIEWQTASASATGSFPYATSPENAFEVPVNEVLQSSSSSFLITVHYTGGSTATAQLSPRQLAAGNSLYPLQ